MKEIEENLARLISRIDFGKGVILNLGVQLSESVQEVLEYELAVPPEMSAEFFNKLRPVILELEIQGLFETEKGERLLTGEVPVTELFAHNINMPIMDEWLGKMRSDGHLNDASLLFISFFEKQ